MLSYCSLGAGCLGSRSRRESALWQYMGDTWYLVRCSGPFHDRRSRGLTAVNHRLYLMYQAQSTLSELRVHSSKFDRVDFAFEHAEREAGRARFLDGVYADVWSGHARVDPAKVLATALHSCEVCV